MARSPYQCDKSEQEADDEEKPERSFSDRYSGEKYFEKIGNGGDDKQFFCR